MKPIGKLCLRKPTSFFNELEIENELCSGMISFLCKLEPKGKLCLRRYILFFNKLEIELELCSKEYFSFFNELDIEWELFSRKTDMMVR